MSSHIEVLPWVKFISRWALVPAIAAIVLFITIGNMNSVAGNVPLEQTYLIGGSNSPMALRALAITEVVLWMSIGGLFLAFSNMFKNSAPIRSTFIAGIGIIMGASSLGGLLHLKASADLASRYIEATGADQAAIVQQYLTLFQTIEAHFTFGELCSAIGYVLIGSVALSFQGFPKWLATWLALSGIYSAITFSIPVLFGTPVPFIMIPIYVLLFSLALHVAITIKFWNPKKLFRNDRTSINI